MNVHVFYVLELKTIKKIRLSVGMSVCLSVCLYVGGF